MSPGPSIVYSGEKTSKEATCESEEKNRGAKKVSKEGLTDFIMPLRDERGYGLVTGFGKRRPFTKVASLVQKVTQAYLSGV